MEKPINKFWVDESGDCGFNFRKGSSRFFVIASVYFIDVGANEELVDREIKNLKEKLRITENYEFKFSRCKEKLKKEFFEMFCHLPVEYKAIVIDKTKIEAPGLKHQPQQLYCEAMRRLLYDNDPPFDKATLFLDEATAKIHHKEFNWVLKNYLSKNIVSKIKQKISKNETMIQVADMVTGAIFRFYNRNDNQYYEIIKRREKILIKF